jgi:hypothetical protein
LRPLWLIVPDNVNPESQTSAISTQKKPSICEKVIDSNSPAQNRVKHIATVHPSKAASLRRERAYEKLNPEDVITFQDPIDELDRDFEGLSTVGQASPRLYISRGK